MKYYITHAENKFPQYGGYEFHFVERDLYLQYDNIEHQFGLSDFLTSFLKPCSEESSLQHIELNSRYVILIFNDEIKKFEPIKQILEI